MFKIKFKYIQHQNQKIQIFIYPPQIFEVLTNQPENEIDAAKKFHIFPVQNFTFFGSHPSAPKNERFLLRYIIQWYFG